MKLEKVKTHTFHLICCDICGAFQRRRADENNSLCSKCAKKVIDKLKAPKDMFNGAIFNTNKSGKIEVLNYLSAKNIQVRFINTGSVKTASACKIRQGKVFDSLALNVAGVGFIGYGPHRSGTEVYRCWNNMLRRCYSDKDPAFKYYGAKGVYVCSEWHNFQNFADWYYQNKPNDGGKHDLDKDIKSGEFKVYSPETCLLVSHQENMKKAVAKRYVLINPNGDRELIYCMNEFCRDKDLDSSSMGKLFRGEIDNYKGWTREY